MLIFIVSFTVPLVLFELNETLFHLALFEDIGCLFFFLVHILFVCLFFFFVLLRSGLCSSLLVFLMHSIMGRGLIN